MSEILRTAIEIAPVAAAAGGAGAYADYLMSRRVAAERQPVSEVMAEVNESLPQVSRLNQLGRHAVSTVAVVATLVGGVNAYAWFGGESPKQSEPNIGLVVDRSGATAFGSEPTPAERVNAVAKDFADEGDAEVTAFVGKGGQTIPSKAGDVISIQPFGNAPMVEAFGTAVADARLTQTEQQKSGDEPSSSAVVVATNGNTFGSAADIARKVEEVDAPVYVIDVADGTDAKTSAQFRRVARRTEGEYWDAEDVENQSVAQMVADDLAPAESKPEEEENKWPERVIFGLLSVAALARLAKDRFNMPLTFKGSKVNR